MPLLTADFISYRGVARAAAVVGGFCALLFILFLAIGLAGGPTLPWSVVFGVAVFAAAAFLRRNRKGGFGSLVVGACVVAVLWSGCTARPEAFGGRPFFQGVLFSVVTDIPIAAVATLLAFVLVPPSSTSILKSEDPP